MRAWLKLHHDTLIVLFVLLALLAIITYTAGCSEATGHLAGCQDEPRTYCCRAGCPVNDRPVCNEEVPDGDDDDDPPGDDDDDDCYDCDGDDDDDSGPGGGGEEDDHYSW